MKQTKKTSNTVSEKISIKVRPAEKRIPLPKKPPKIMEDKEVYKRSRVKSELRDMLRKSGKET